MEIFLFSILFFVYSILNILLYILNLSYLSYLSLLCILFTLTKNPTKGFYSNNMPFFAHFMATGYNKHFTFYVLSHIFGILYCTRIF